MAFLKNKAINRVNLHFGIQSLALNAGGLFFLVFLLRGGLSVPETLLAQSAIVTGRFALRPLLLILSKYWGLRSMLICGTLLMSLQYLVLPQVHGIDLALALLCLVSSLGEVFYWVSFHAYFASIGDSEHRGHQIGVRETLAALATVIAPLLGAWGLLTLGGFWTFALVALVQAMAAIPLLNAPDVPIKRSVKGVFQAARPAIILLISDGWICACFWIVWQIALFITLKENISSYGGAMALAGVVGAVFGLMMGRQIDAGHGRKAVGIALLIEAIIIVFRASSLHSSWLADFSNALGSLLTPLLASVMGTVLYNLSKGSPCAFRFIVATEAGWDIGCFMACVIGAGVYASGLPLSCVLLMALPGIAIQAVLLMGHYPQSESKTPLPVVVQKPLPG